MGDLNQGLPFRSDSFKRVVLRQIVEHVDDLTGFMAEVHRICLPEALVYILTPHFSAAASYTDPSHRRHMGLFSFDYYCGLNTDDFMPLGFGFNLTGRRIKFGRKERLGIGAWANRHARVYEQHLAWLLPALDVEIILSARK